MATPTYNVTGGNSQDVLKQLLQTSFDRSNSLFGTSTGLSPEAMSALQTQGTSGINNQYQSAAQAVNSQLLRRGAVGQGALPSSGGDISRAYQPLYTAMEQAKTKAQTDTILANEAQKNTSLYQNNQLAQGALNGAGGFANELANIEPANIGRLLGTSVLSSALSPGGLGGLFTGGGTNGTGRFGVVGDALGGLFGGGGGNLAAPAEGSVFGPPNPNQGVFGPNNPNSIGEIAGLGTSGIAALLGGGGGTAAGAAAGLGPGLAGGAGGVGGGAFAGGGGLLSGLGLGAATVPVIGAAVAGIGLLAKHFFGNGADRQAANQLTDPNSPYGVHAFFTQATQQIAQLPPEQQAAAADARDREFEQALVNFSKLGKAQYYQAKQTLEQFSQFSSVKALLG